MKWNSSRNYRTLKLFRSKLTWNWKRLYSHSLNKRTHRVASGSAAESTIFCLKIWTNITKIINNKTTRMNSE